MQSLNTKPCTKLNPFLRFEGMFQVTIKYINVTYYISKRSQVQISLFHDNTITCTDVISNSISKMETACKVIMT